MVSVLLRLSLLAIAFSWTAGARAADPVTVLEQVRRATGGAAWSTVRALHQHARLAAGDRRGTIDRFDDVATGRFLREAHLPAHDVAEGFDGVSVWTTGRDGVAYVSGDADARLGAADESYRVARGWWRPDLFPATIAEAGAERDGGRSFDLVRITPEAGRPFTLWVDRQTHLVDRLVEQHAESLAVTRYADYRRAGPLLLPFTIRTGDGDASSDDVESVEQVEIDPPIEGARFALPPLPASASASSAPVTVVPFRFENGQILVNVTLDGRIATDALFDSGGSLVVPPTVLAELGAGAAQGSSRMTGGGEGSVASGVGVVESLAIGAAAVTRPGFLSFAWDPAHPRRLIVGLEVLQRYVVHLDFDARTMTLISPDRFILDGTRDRGEVLPFHFESNQPEVVGSVDGVAATFAVDTGDNGSLLLIAPFARKYGFAARYRAVIPYGGSSVTATRGLMARAGEIALDGLDGRPVVRVARPVTRISTQAAGFDANRYVSANLGTGVLRQFNVTFDYARRRIVLAKNRHFGEVDNFELSGMKVKHAGAPAQLVVDTVVPGGPADRAGIRTGDVVVAIDGAAASSLDPDALEARLNTTSGAAVRLRFLRGTSAPKEVTVILHDVL